MLAYIILFCVLGAILGLLFPMKAAISIILVITVGWAVVQGPWAVATLLELLLGYAIGLQVQKFIRENKDELSSEEQHDER